MPMPGISSLPGLQAAASTGGLPWNIILPIALAYFSNLFSDNDPEVDAVLQKLEMDKYAQTLRGMGMSPPYRSPHLAGLDTATLKAILNQLNRSKNWGWPGGKQLDMSFITDLLGNVGSGGAITPTGRQLRRF